MGDVTKLPVKVRGKKPSDSEEEQREFFKALLRLCREYGVDIQRGGQVLFMEKGSGKPGVQWPGLYARYLLHTVDSNEVAVETLNIDPKTGGYRVITVTD